MEAGVKFAANFWLRLYDFQTPHEAACTNSDHDECGGRGCAIRRGRRAPIRVCV